MTIERKRKEEKNAPRFRREKEEDDDCKVLGSLSRGINTLVLVSLLPQLLLLRMLVLLVALSQTLLLLRVQVWQRLTLTG